MRGRVEQERERERASWQLHSKKRREASMATLEGALKPIRALLEARAAHTHTELVYRQATLTKRRPTTTPTFGTR